MNNLIKQEVKNKFNLEQSLIDNICNFFGVLSDDPELASQIAAYIIDGATDDVPDNLKTNRKVAETLGYTANHYGLHQKRQRMLQAKHQAPPHVWQRMAQVLDAIVGSTGNASTFPPNYPSWAGALIMETATLVNSYYGIDTKAWSALELEKIFIAAELPGDLLVMPLLGAPAPYFATKEWYTYQHNPNAGCFANTDQYLQHHIDAVKQHLAALTTADTRLECLDTLRKAKFNFAPIADTIAQLACGSSKQLRDSALAILITCPDAARPQLEHILAKGPASERNEAVLALWRLYGKEISPVLSRHAEHESADRVKQTIAKLTAAPDDGSVTCAQLLEALPPYVVETGVVPLSELARTKILEYLFPRSLSTPQSDSTANNKQTNPQANAASDGQALATLHNSGAQQPSGKKDWLSDQDIVVSFIEGHTEELLKRKKGHSFNAFYSRTASSTPPTGPWLSELTLMHLVRLSMLLHHFRLPQNEWQGFQWHEMRMLEEYRSLQTKKFGLRELDAAVAALPGVAKSQIANSYISTNFDYYNVFDWEADAIWPLFAEQRDIITRYMSGTPATYDYYFEEKRKNAFKIITLFPRVPAELTAELWQLALGEAKRDRLLAQEALSNLPGKAPKILIALKDGKQSIRSAAADWLGRLGDPIAIEPLKEAFQKEKNEVCRATMMFALDALGANVDEFLNREALLEEARSGLSKKRPKGMEWVPLDSVPKVHWQDTGKQVDPQILQWWIVQTIQQKLPGCGPILRKYLSMCNKTEATRFARFVLTTWIARDTENPPAEECAKKAQEQTERCWGMQYYRDNYKDKDNLYKLFYQNFSSELLYSAIEQKGMLSIVSGAGDTDCVKVAEQYIRKYYGTRLAQCKSLIDTLAWLENPMALQVLLSIANRFRTKSLREAAQDHVNAVADRLGWTIDELADRTIPDAGFERPVDENDQPIGTEAILQLDYGPRQFEVRLNDDLEPVINVKGESKPLKAPPAPGKNDDEEKAKAAKKIFSDAKKVVKDVVKRQSERLYEAMVTQRSWKFCDWQIYLAQHPVMGRLCTRVVWSVVEKQEDGTCTFVNCFRPLEDGSLTDDNDNPVTVHNDATVILAHTCNLPAERDARWKQHFEDYDVTPLFSQFGRTAYVLQDEKKKLTDLEDFLGYGITTFKLRGKATKLGYQRGEAEDGGCFAEYRKSFVALNMMVVIEFTGSMLPEEDVPAALTNMSFHMVRPGDQSSWNSTKIALEKVPPVLLTECYNDLRLIAAEGSGFDAKWREKSYF